MPLVDVTKPVVINATTSILRETSEHLRRVCLVSIGMTNLAINEYKEVFSYDWRNYILPYTEIKEKIQSFFSQANNKSVTLLELGKQNGTPLESTYLVLLQYCETFPKFSLTKFYASLYTSWKKRDTDETKDVLIGFYNQYQPNNPFNAESFQTWVDLNQKDPDSTDSYKEYFDQLLPKNWKDSYYNYLAQNIQSFTDMLTLDNLMQYVTGLAGENAFFIQSDYDIYLEENGTKDSDFSDKVTLLNNFITEGKQPCYIFVLPTQMGNYEELGTELFSLYSGLNQPTYFFLNFKNTIEDGYVTSNALSQVKGQKSSALFVDNSVGYDLSALAAGLFASNKFDLSTTNPASPMNYKVLQGVKFTAIGNTYKQQMIQDSVNFIDSIATSTVLLNGRYGDTTSIDYRYQWDLTSYNIEANLKQLILNGVNNPLYVIKYNQDGIDVLKSRVKSTLQNMIEIGAVTEYAQSLNQADNSLEGLNEIECIGFRQYINAKPEDYQNEIYGGISFYLRIGKYIRQVILNVTLG